MALITYTNAAADEIATRLVTHFPIFIGTIHRFCLEFILRPFSWIYNWNKPRILSYDELNNFIENNKLKLSIDELNLIKNDINGNINLNVGWNNINPIKKIARKYFLYLDSI